MGFRSPGSVAPAAPRPPTPTFSNQEPLTNQSRPSRAGPAAESPPGCPIQDPSNTATQRVPSQNPTNPGVATHSRPSGSQCGIPPNSGTGVAGIYVKGPPVPRLNT